MVVLDRVSSVSYTHLNVGAMIEKNYGGVRIDGTNATIIGDGDGNFIADRNGIARVSVSYTHLDVYKRQLLHQEY